MVAAPNKRFLVDVNDDVVTVRIELGDRYYARVLYEDILWNLQTYQGFKIWVEYPDDRPTVRSRHGSRT